MWFARHAATDPPFAAAASLPSQLIEDAAGDDVFRLRRDAVRAARVLEEVQPALAFTIPQDEPHRTLGPRQAWLLAAAGVVVGVILTFLLMRTVFAPAIACHSYSDGTFSCVRR